MRPTVLILCAWAACATPGATQQFAYSPAAAATTPGFASITTPFLLERGQPYWTRYQQLHSDLRSTSPRILQGLDLRPGPLGANQSARTVDLALTLADTDVSRANTFFDSNLAANRTTVISRKPINFPDLQTKGWTVPLTFDAPYLVQGTRDFAWDLSIFGIAAPANADPSYYLDYYEHTSPSRVIEYGNTCTATGQSPPLLPQILISARANFRKTIYLLRMLYGASSQPAGVAFGIGRTNLALAGWCTNVHVNPLLYLMGRTDAFGYFNTGIVEIPYVAAMANATFNAQFYCADPVQGIVLSRGQETTMPALPQGVAMRVVGDLSKAEGVTDDFGNAGLVVRLRQ